MHDAIAGRVLCAGFPGLEIPAGLQRRLEADALGGVILFKRNLPSLEHLHRLTHGLASAGLNPIVAIDQEGGRVARLGAPFLRLPAMRRLGELDDLELTQAVGRELGLQLRALGVTLDFAPVLDVDTNPANPVIGDRAFGRDPEFVARHGLALLRGLQSAGVAACGKHFPGHGDTDVDSHLALPRLPHTLERLAGVELVPFRAAAAEVASIMTAHVVFDAVDANVPATLSRRVIDGVLRTELGFRGVIVSDDLEMRAIADHFGTGEAAVQAIEAGCDLLLVCSQPDQVEVAIEALCRRADHDARFATRLHDAASRVSQMRRAFPCKPEPTPRTESNEARSIEARLFT